MKKENAIEKSKIVKVIELVQFYQKNRRCLPYAGWVGYGNLGDEAMYSAFNMLFRNNNSFPFMPTTVQLKVLRNVRKKFGALALGGGTLIGRDAFKDIISFAVSSHIPFFTFGTGVLNPTFWGENNLQMNEWVPLLKKCKFVGVRGEVSKEILVKCGVENVKVVGDPALFFSGEHYDLDMNVGKKIGINIGNITGGEIWGESMGCVRVLMAEVIAKLIADNFDILFFNVSKKDAIAHEEIMQLIGLKLPQKFYTDVCAYLKDVKTCTAFIGMKLHSVILAYAAYTPVIMIEYRPKCYDFMHSVDRLKFNIRSSEIVPEKILELVDECVRNRKKLVEEQVAKCDDYKKRLVDYCDEIRETLSLN